VHQNFMPPKVHASALVTVCDSYLLMASYYSCLMACKQSIAFFLNIVFDSVVLYRMLAAQPFLCALVARMQKAQRVCSLRATCQVQSAIVYTF
jgi:hypothetical protein